MAKLFISVLRLDDWIERSEARLVGEQLNTASGVTYKLGPATYFVSVLGGRADTLQMLGRVKSKAQLEQMGARREHGFVRVGDLTYQVVEGFLGEPLN